MTAPNDKTSDEKVAETLKALQRRAIANAIERGVTAGAFHLAHPKVLADLQWLAGTELHVDAKGEIPVNVVHSWLLQQHREKAFYFARNAPPPRSPFDRPRDEPDGVPADRGPDGDPPLPTGARRWIDASEMGDNLDAIASGEVAVRSTSDASTGSTRVGRSIAVGKAGDRIADIASGKVRMADGSAPAPRDPTLSAWTRDGR